MTQRRAASRSSCILVVDKDESLRLEVTGALESAGYEVAIAADALNALKKLYRTYPDLIIVVREIPMLNGEDAYLRIRQSTNLPIIVIGSQEEMAEMLESGADAYMTKPTNLNELLARVRALLRRKSKWQPPGSSIIAEDKNSPSDDGNGFNGLTPTEFRLASCLFCNTGQMLSYSEIISMVWGGKKVSLDTLHYYMRCLRKKLAVGCISIFRGVGYCFSREGL